MGSEGSVEGTEIGRRGACDGRDPAIKLFGRTIPMPEAGVVTDPDPSSAMEDFGKEDECKEISELKIKAQMPNAQEELEQIKAASSTCLDTGDEDDHQGSTQNVKTTSDSKPDQDQDEVNASNQEKLMKKPDKIVPCPRCNSMETKFCYYNNYNVNQPRHFCKNCQRYWTAGGTMRNVPVGAGRRKSKHSVPHNRQMMLSDGVPCNRPDAPDHPLSCGSSAPIRPLNGNAAILKFGPEAPVSGSMASVLNIEDQKRNIDTKSVDSGEKLEVEASNNLDNDSPETVVPTSKNDTQLCFNGVSPIPQVPCYPGPPFVFPWNAGWNNVAAMAAGQFPSELFNGQWNGSPNPIPWRPPMLAAPPFCSPAIPFPFMPASFWGYMSSWPNGAWNVPWMGSNTHLPPPPCTSNSGCSGNGSPALGKHSRDTSLDGEEKTERKSLWAPKTLRIDDPDEAAKSSIWATLGIEPDEAIKKGGVLKVFHSKTTSKDIVADSTPALLANPAALCRSQAFQEST